MKSNRPVKTSRKVTEAVDPLDIDDFDAREDGDARGTDTDVAAAAPNRLTLTILAGQDEGRVFPIEGDEVWVGRGDDCQIVLADKDVSRRHACVIREGARLLLKDNGTKNGTFVNNRRVVEHELEPDDEIRLGPTLCLVFSDAQRVSRARSGARALRERFLADKTQSDKADAIATVVAGVAHEINTPLGVASTAAALIEALAEEVRRDPTSEKIGELLADLSASTGLMTKNLERASRLVNTFKKLSTSELGDERLPCELRTLIDECVGALRVDLALRQIVVRTTFHPDGAEFPWLGFRKSLTEVLVHIVRNAIHYAYDDDGGRVEIRLQAEGATCAGASRYRLEIEDFGAGLSEEILARMFEPFAAAPSGNRGIGVGLAIVRNIVTNLLAGTIICTSERGKGTRFVIDIPCEVPLAPTETATGK